MKKRTLKRLGIAVAFPALYVLGFWQHLGDSTGAAQLLLPAAIAMGLSIGIFLYAPLARQFKSR
ncbi:MAG: hypothetical protein OXI38_01675 [Bacteroidota bacterium]|nr:hypothetical protein [Bacteroidota bacterium]